MALTAAAGIFGFGPQAGKGVVAPTFYRHRAVQVDLGVNDDVRLGQLEVGGTPVPTFPYKAGYIVGGGASLQPRLENTFGWLLYGALGKCTTVADADPSDTGVYEHTFEMAADAAAVPWMSARKVIPRKDGDAATDLGETYTDMKIVGLGFQLPTDNPLTARVDMLGCDFALDSAPDGFVWNNSYEDWESIPVACMTDGYIKVAGAELPVVGANFNWVNQPLDPRQEKVIGSPKLEDVTIISRMLQFELIVKYNDPQLYRQVLTGSTTGTAWSGQPHVASLDIKTVSGKNMTAMNDPWSLRAVADNVLLQQVGGIQLAGGQAVMMRFQGTAIESNAATYARFILRNLHPAYTWPV